MRRNGVLLSRENADRMQQVRAEIGRRLKERYDAGVWLLPKRLADLVKKIQHPNRVCEKGWPMGKPDEYRANAQECERMAAISRNPNEKAALLQMAQQWLGMISKVEPAQSQFDAAGNAFNRQTKSEESH
jgi:hypothetical protein